MLFGLIALAIGTLFGPLQAFEHAGWDLYPIIRPLFRSYYQGLTLHGVLNALVYTTFFITGFFTLTVIYGLQRRLRFPAVNKVGFWMMVVGLVTAAIPILLQRGHGALHVLRAAEGELGLLCGADVGRGRQLDRRLRLLLHLHGLAQGKPRASARRSSPSAAW